MGSHLQSNESFFNMKSIKIHKNILNCYFIFPPPLFFLLFVSLTHLRQVMWYHIIRVTAEMTDDVLWRHVVWLTYMYIVTFMYTHCSYIRTQTFFLALFKKRKKNGEAACVFYILPTGVELDKYVSHCEWVKDKLQSYFFV